jgi:hypothetical protein
MLRHKFQNFFLWPAFTLLVAFSQSAPGADYDVVISNGRVMNPASGLDSIRNVGISNGKIVILSREAISGAQEIDASGLVNGVFVVRNGTYQENTYPGKPIRR